MPQMAPISWLTLFIMFSLTLILFCMMNYFCYNQQSPFMLENKMISSLSLNWKW